MRFNRTMILSVAAVSVLSVLCLLPSLGTLGTAASADAVRDGAGKWLHRTVWACDQRKSVIVEGVRPDERMEPEKARQVAHLLQDLMRFCNETITARVTMQEEIFLSVNGLPYRRYVMGGELPIQLVHKGQEHKRREQMIWKSEYDKLVKEGHRVFHDPKLGTNGISCDMCHPDASNTHPETYPKFQTQLKSMALLRDMINWCVENPLEGTPLADDDSRIKAMEAYIYDARRGVPLEGGKH